MSAEFQSIDLLIPEELAGKRLDAALARLMPEHSRTRIKAWIDAGQVQVGRRACRPRDVVEAGSRVLVRMSPEIPQREVLPEQIALTLVHEDRDVLVVDKPAGLVVHPGAGQPGPHAAKCVAGLGSALARRCRAPGSSIGSTRTPADCWWWPEPCEAQTSLTRQLMARSVEREYLAVCVGVMTGGGTVDEPIGRHRTDRLRMAVRQDGRPAVTHYRVIERFRAHTYLKVKLETGRTHQIRLHLAHLRYPIVGDPVYGGRLGLPKGRDGAADAALRTFKRQALHAARLAFDHPRTGKRRELRERACRRTMPNYSRRCERMQRACLRRDPRDRVVDSGLAGARPRAFAVDAAAGRRERGALRLPEPGHPRGRFARGSCGQSPGAAGRGGTAGGTSLAGPGPRIGRQGPRPGGGRSRRRRRNPASGPCVRHSHGRLPSGAAGRRSGRPGGSRACRLAGSRGGCHRGDRERPGQRPGRADGVARPLHRPPAFRDRRRRCARHCSPPTERPKKPSARTHGGASWRICTPWRAAGSGAWGCAKSSGAASVLTSRPTGFSRIGGTAAPDARRRSFGWNRRPAVELDRSHPHLADTSTIHQGFLPCAWTS